MTGSSPSTGATRVLPFNPSTIAEAAGLIRAGGCVAVPTETVYGLAADATSSAAVAGIYAAKGRPSFNPLIVHVADVAMAATLAQFGPLARTLAAAFWPGPLTLVLPLSADADLAPAVTAGLPTVAIRCPAHPAMQALIAASARPLAAPSANASGTVSPTTAAHVLATLERRIALVLDDGACAGGIESTIVAVDGVNLRLLRSGPVSEAMLAAATGALVTNTGDDSRITAPGQLASHYAPGKPVVLNCTAPPADAFMIGFGDVGGNFQLSATSDLTEAAAALFAALHRGAISQHRIIAVAPIPETGLGIAINDRLRRAAA